MALKRSFGDKINTVVARLRTDGVVRTVLDYLPRAGLYIKPFYYMKEMLPTEIPVDLTTFPHGFDFSVFGPVEIEAIGRIAERGNYVPETYVLKNFNKGDTCLGVKHQGEIVAFTWFSLDESRIDLYPVKMKPNEAFLYDMYVLQAFRGRNLAPALRYRSYEILKGMGRDTFYSITEYFNVASLRFKHKLGAKIVFFALFIKFFNRSRCRWVVWRY